MSTGTLDLVVTRVFDAPVEHLWRAWISAELVKCWWGPAGFTAPVAEMNVREGESSLVCMRSPDGHDFYNTWTYDRVVPCQRLEFDLAFVDENRTAVEPAQLGLPPDIPPRVRHVVQFRPVGETATELTVTESGYSSQQTVEISRLGLEQSLDKMAACLASGHHSRFHDHRK